MFAIYYSFSVALPPWALMWTIAVLMYASLKALSWSQRRTTAVPLWGHAAYLFAWPGMDVDGFFDQARTRRPTLAEVLFAFSKTSLGLVLLFAVVPALAGVYPYWLGCLGMIGIVLTLHFGLFHLLSCLWRQLGLNAVPIMNWPILSLGVSEFWGRRWNLAFRDLTHRFLFRPLSAWLGAIGALLGGFFVSGLIHDIVISLPAGGGYGRPTCYFLIQAVAILFERSRAGRQLGLGRGVRGWLFTFVVILLPVGLLLHTPFVMRVIVPFLQALGSIR